MASIHDVRIVQQGDDLFLEYKRVDNRWKRLMNLKDIADPNKVLASEGGLLTVRPIDEADVVDAEGSGNQLLGLNAAGNAAEYKSLTSDDESVTITHTANGIDLAAAGGGGGGGSPFAEQAGDPVTIDLTSNYIVA